MNEEELITKNKTIMDYVIQYVRREEIDNREIEVIDHVRLYKHMILPCELMGFDGRRQIKESREWEEKSTMRWDVKFDNITKP